MRTISAVKKIVYLLELCEHQLIFRTLAIIALTSLVPMGCALVDLKKEVKQSLESTIIAGQVTTGFPGKGPIIVAACTMERGQPQIEHYTVLHDNGEFELLVKKGTYTVIGYWDKNRNLTYDAGEPAGQFDEPRQVSAPAGGVVQEINFSILAQGEPIDLPHGFVISPTVPEKLYSRMAGAIVDLDDALYAEKNGRRGYWEPLSFYKEIGGNVYFLEPYDPEKIPVLFIHGATGTPKGWREVVKHMDRTRFQPWFFYYPSGARIKSMSYLLMWKLVNLKHRYRFDTFHMAAHSMGGLVARSFIMDYGRIFPGLTCFVAMATPWGGDPMAVHGVRQSPAIIPSWIDMQPHSEFITSLYRSRMPDQVRFYMFYGHKGNRRPWSANNDGTIVFSSLLDIRPQSEARMNFAFNEDHASIISSRAAIAQFNTILDASQGPAAATRQTGGYLQLNITGLPNKGVGRGVSLVLRPQGTQKAETAVYLHPDDDVIRLGPLPLGRYTVNVISLHAAADKTDVPVTIAIDRTAVLDFNMTPDGAINGYVTTSRTPGDRPVGMPATQYLPHGDIITVQSITLTGDNIHRTLHSTVNPDTRWKDHITYRKDICINNEFAFFGLPAGVYRIDIKVQGYRPVTVQHTVTPGDTRLIAVTELTPEE